MQKNVVIIAFVVLISIPMLSEPASSLTRESVRDHGHLFSYSIQPSWQSGPITDSDFRLIFSLFNDSKDPYHLRKIALNKPEGLRVKRRSWDDAPRMRPRGRNTSINGEAIVVTYNETLRGFVKGKPIKGRIIYANMAVAEDQAVTEPLTVDVHWAQSEDADTRTLTLEKELKINAGK